MSERDFIRDKEALSKAFGLEVGNEHNGIDMWYTAELLKWLTWDMTEWDEFPKRIEEEERKHKASMTYIFKKYQELQGKKDITP